MNFIEYLADIREEERLSNLVESLIASEEEKRELEKLAEKNTISFMYFKNLLAEHDNFLALQKYGDGRLNYSQIGKAFVHISYDTDMYKLIKKVDDL